LIGRIFVRCRAGPAQLHEALQHVEPERSAEQGGPGDHHPAENHQNDPQAVAALVVAKAVPSEQGRHTFDLLQELSGLGLRLSLVNNRQLQLGEALGQGGALPQGIGHVDRIGVEQARENERTTKEIALT
jgi:hypothetical protein